MAISQAFLPFIGGTLPPQFCPFELGNQISVSKISLSAAGMFQKQKLKTFQKVLKHVRQAMKSLFGKS